MWSVKAWRRRRILRRSGLSESAWRAAVEHLPLLAGLSDAELERLRELVVLFLHDKRIEGVGGLELTEPMRLAIALQACLPILNLGLDWYAGWVTVLVYPETFVPEHEYQDAAGVVHRVHEPLAGEAWARGPVILAWPDVEPAGDGVNLVIHEFAHKLDMLNGASNGLPPLHRGMDVGAWSRAFSAAYEDLKRRLAAGEATLIDPYAAEAPGEFFAVLSEVFFENPRPLRRLYPAVYEQLAAFYRQDPAARKVTSRQ